MSPALIALLSAIDILLYTIRSYANKLFAISYNGRPTVAAPVFSAITGFLGFLFTVLSADGIQLPGLTTLLCGVSAGCILFLYDLGNIRAAKTGPYSVQAIVCVFGCVMLPLLFERLLWSVRLTSLQKLGVMAVLISFVYLNLNNKESGNIHKGFYGWLVLLFFANGIYSTIVTAGDIVKVCSGLCPVSDSEQRDTCSAGSAECRASERKNRQIHKDWHRLCSDRHCRFGPVKKNYVLGRQKRIILTNIGEFAILNLI